MIFSGVVENVRGFSAEELVDFFTVHFYHLVMNKKQTVKALSHAVFSIHAHLVIVTKYRKKCITSQMISRLKEIFESLCDDWECELLEFNGEADHVHLLLSLNPKVQPSKFVNNLKTVSSRRIRSEFQPELAKVLWKDAFWSRSYCFISCGGSPLEILKQYIQSHSAPE